MAAAAAIVVTAGAAAAEEADGAPAPEATSASPGPEVTEVAVVPEVTEVAVVPVLPTAVAAGDPPAEAERRATTDPVRREGSQEPQDSQGPQGSPGGPVPPVAPPVAGRDEDPSEPPPPPAPGPVEEPVLPPPPLPLVRITPLPRQAPTVLLPDIEVRPDVRVAPPTPQDPVPAVVVTAAPTGADTLAVRLEPDPVPSEPVPPVVVTVTDPEPGLEVARAVVDSDEAGVHGITITPPTDPGDLGGAGGRRARTVALDLALLVDDPDGDDGAEAGAAPVAVAVASAGGDRRRAHVAITLGGIAGRRAIERGVELRAPARGDDAAVVELRRWKSGANDLRLTLVPADGAAPTEPAPAPTDPAPVQEPPPPRPPATVAASTEVAPERSPARSVGTVPLTVPDQPHRPAPERRRPSPRPEIVFGPEMAPKVVEQVGRRSFEAARTFPVPSGLIVAVLLFLAAQGWVDRRDPRLTAAPVDQPQEVRFR